MDSKKPNHSLASSITQLEQQIKKLEEDKKNGKDILSSDPGENIDDVINSLKGELENYKKIQEFAQKLNY